MLYVVSTPVLKPIVWGRERAREGARERKRGRQRESEREAKEASVTLTKRRVFTKERAEGD